MASSTESAADIEAIERATVAAVSPPATEEFDGWLLAFDTVSVTRAKSAAPLAHSAFAPRVLQKIEERYVARGHPPIFRLADVPAFDSVRAELRRRGYASGPASLVQAAATERVRKASTQPPAEVADKPDAAWTAVFIGPGFDPVDGASRALTLSRTPGSVYASVRENGRAIACGAGSFAYGWGSIHGMRTEQTRRGEGLAGRVLAALAAVAAERGMARMFLQVEEDNPGAVALYRRVGFRTLWRYEYWQRAA